MSLLRKRAVLLAKTEGTYNTDPTLSTSADAIIVENPQPSWPTEVVDRPLVDISLSPFKPLHGRKYAQLQFDVELKGSGTAGTAPDWGPLIEACGFDETISASTSVTYTPLSTGFESIYMELYMDGVMYAMGGCRGNVELIMPAGQRPMLRFTFMGHAVAKADETFPTSITVDSTVPGIVKNSSFTMGGYAAVISSLNANMQNQVIVPDSVNAADGYGEVQITGRDPAGSFDPEAVLVATNDYWSDWEDGTTQALSIAVNNGAGNIATITAPVVTYRELNPGDRDGILTYEIPFTLARSSGDDEISIALT